MKILLDESLPVKLCYDFGAGHQVLTVRDMNWLGKKNGELMKLITSHNFEVFVTANRNLIYQQNVSSLTIIVAVLCGSNNRISTYQKLIPKLLDFLSQNTVPQVLEIS